MSLPVFLCADVTGVAAGAEVVLEGDEGRHAVVVRRTRVGEGIVLTDGAGTAATCEVTGTARAALTARVSSVSVAPREEPSVTVVQAIPKGDRGELAVEVLTEVGVDRIVPWTAERCVAVWRGERAAKSLGKWRASAREAAKQARRAWFPSVAEPASTAEVVGILAAADLAVVLHEEATAPLASLPVAGTGSMVVVVGPEGGLTEEELAAFADAHVVRLGSSVLRTSTAGVAAVAALLARTPRWS
ncbi:MAG TPA: 16S rRNA (uracil(1498)-N(3))-methyltransferase [Marmoricola sp.]|nr:16S rRNA (uracil(1498)-N(3))-methyltransferase [Marmoricola sp.]